MRILGNLMQKVNVSRPTPLHTINRVSPTPNATQTPRSSHELTRACIGQEARKGVGSRQPEGGRLGMQHCQGSQESIYSLPTLLRMEVGRKEEEEEEEFT